MPDGIEVGRRVPLASLLFHVANFPRYVGDPVARGTNGQARARVTFPLADFNVELDWVANHAALWAELKRQAGYAITHVGRLTRRDGSLFDASVAVDLMDVLYDLLGFVRGGWSGPLLLAGISPAGTVAWQQWSVRRVSPVDYRPSWFDPFDPAAITRLALGFANRRLDSAWGEAFHRAVALYVEANRMVPIDTAIVLAQSGLELLAWMSFVASGSTTASEFETWNAADRMSRLLAAASISPAIPSSLTGLDTLRSVVAAWDGPTLVAYVRNRFIHPPRGHARRIVTSAETIGAWRLSIHYLEVMLLFLSGYRGAYRSRVDDAVTVTPWS